MVWYNPATWGQKDASFKNADEYRDQINRYMQGVDAREAPTIDRTKIGQVKTGQAAQIATGEQGQFRNMQVDLANRLAGVATGQQKGAGQMAVDDQVRRGVAGQQAMARMSRGPSAGMAARTAARGAAELEIAGAGQAAQAGVADQQAANAQLAQVAGGARAQDVALAESQANLQQQMNLTNLSAENQAIFQQAGLDQARNLAEVDAKLRMTGMNDQARAQYMSQLMGISQAELAATLAENEKNAAILGSVLGAGGQIGAAYASDMRVKEKITSADSDIDELLSVLGPYSWVYKDTKHGKGRHAGVMAQDLEKSKIGKEMVREVDGVKMVDSQKALSAALAATARLNKRVGDLEKDKKVS